MTPSICLMNDSFPPLIDGVATTVNQYAHNIVKNYGQAVVATPDYPGAVDDYPFPVVRYPSIATEKLVGYRTGLPFSAASLRELSSYPISVIHSHCPFISTYLARTLRQTVHAPVIFTYHTKFDYDIARAVHSGQIQSAAIKLMVDNVSACDEVWVVSRGAGENLRSLGYEGEYRLMENGVDFPRGKVEPEIMDSLRASFLEQYHEDLCDGKPTFLFVGRMMWYKGLRLILDALAKIKSPDLPFRMIFIGDGGDIEEVRAYSEKLNLSDRCIFTGAIRDRTLLRAYYSLCTLFLFPSSYDTNGLVVREAAACALPSMLIRGSCAAEGITDERNGFLVDENADSIAAFLERIAKTPEICKAVGDHAMNEVYLSWEDAVKRACARYDIVRERYLSGEHKTPEPLSDEIFIRISELLGTVNRVHKSGEDLRTKTEEVLRRSIEKTEDNNAKIKEYLQNTAEQLLSEAEAFGRDSTREAKAIAARYQMMAETLIRRSGERLELHAKNLKDRGDELRAFIRSRRK
ncbi:MAG: glycosyltransferase [Clostridia bacterium]|nr:glycosyltransferase [Clostridia bacterium]